MCRPPNAPEKLVEPKRKEIEREKQNRDVASTPTIVAVTATFIGGYSLGVNDTDIRVTLLIGSCGVLICTVLVNFNNLQRYFAPFFRWMSQKTSYSSTSLGRMASKSSGTALSTLSRVTSVDAIKNISKNFLSTIDCSSTLRSAIQSITRKECFTRLDYIERLSINDVSILFRYATNANIEGFEKTLFLDDQNMIVRSVINAIDMAVKVSRGSLSDGTKPVSKTEGREGDLDVLLFVAVVRIFAEWRNLRMVPKGYQRYAINISLAYRDVLQNLEKIERGVHQYLRHHQSLREGDSKTSALPISSPTIRQLLQFELETELHKKLPRLRDPSAASGILWTKRQLHYQTALLANFLEIPQCYLTPKDAATAAYHIVYNDYHGWAVKGIFTHSLGGSPPLDKVWLAIRPPTNMPVDRKRKYQTCGKSCDSNERSSNYPPSLRPTSDLNSASIRSNSFSDSLGDKEDDNGLLAALDNFRDEIVEKWDDLLRMFNCGKEEKKKRMQNLILSSESHFNLHQMNTEMVETSLQNSSSTDSSDINSVVTSSTVASSSSSSTASTSLSRQQVNNHLIQQSKRDAEDFVRNVMPMVADLGRLMDELNMNDPTKA